MLLQSKLKKTFKDLIKHSLFILLFGTLLGSIIIPHINDVSARKRMQYEQKQRIAFDIFKNNLEVTEQLHTLHKTMELFHYEFYRMGSNKKNYPILNEQKALRNRLNPLYLEFNKHAWWWYWDIYHEANIFGLVPTNESDRMIKLFEPYKNNLLKSLKTLDALWYSCIDEKYNPADSIMIKIINHTNTELDSLTSVRTEIIKDFASIISSESFQEYNQVYNEENEGKEVSKKE